MKRVPKSFLQRIAFTLLFSFAIISCERIDSDLVGEWHLDKMNYRITANQDFVFYDLFGEPWQGTITVGNQVFDIASFNYYYDNSWGPAILASKDLMFVFAGSKMQVYLRNEYFVLESYEFDILSGIFKADGIAEGNKKSVSVKVDVTIPKINVKQGNQITVEDGYYRMPYRNIWFKSGGKLQVDYLVGDMMDRTSGRWNVKNDRITLSAKNYDDATYQYNRKGNELILFREEHLSQQYLPHHISPYIGKISHITYVATYSKH